jgi:hypothetical protein
VGAVPDEGIAAVVDESLDLEHAGMFPRRPAAIDPQKRREAVSR